MRICFPLLCSVNELLLKNSIDRLRIIVLLRTICRFALSMHVLQTVS